MEKWYHIKAILRLSNSGVLLFSTFLFLQSCEENLSTENVKILKDQVAVETGKEVEIIYSDSAMVRVRITAPIMYNYLENKQKQEFPTGIKIDFYDLKAQYQSSMTAKYAVRDLESRMVTIRDSIEWHSVRNENLFTEELIWDEKQNIIFTKKFVKITRPGEKMFGYDFKSNQDFSRWELAAGSGWVKSDALSKELNE